MQKQEFKPNETKTSEISSELKDEFQQIKSKPISELIIQPKFRKVTLKYKSCCGCGCSYQDIERQVPYDSKYKDGDIANNFEDGDKMI